MSSGNSSKSLPTLRLDTPPKPDMRSRDVGLEADPLLLAVVADVDAGRLLASTTWRTALSISAAISALSIGFAGLAADQQIGQHVVARQAAHMRGQDSIAAMDHERFLCLGLAGSPQRMHLTVSQFSVQT